MLDTSFGSMLIKSSLPVILQDLLQNSLSFADTLMIGRLGDIEIAAVGLANQIYFLIFVIIFGISSGVSIFTSQLWGHGDKNGIQKTLGVSIIVSLAITSVFSFLSIFVPKSLMRLFVSDSDVIQTGCVYLRTVGISYIFVAVSQAFSVVLRSSGDSVSPMKATLISMVLNVAGNYLLIFSFGMGVLGAALATAISRLVELVILYYIITHRNCLPIKWNTVFSFNGSFVRSILKTSLPVVVDDALWALGMTVYKAVYSHMGIETLVAANICESIQNLLFVIQNGMGIGISVIIGNAIGAGKQKKEVIHYASESEKYILIASVFCGSILALSSTFMPSLFNISTVAKSIIKYSLITLAITMPFKFLNHAIITGILRSGGDTKFVLIVEIFSIWAVGVPAAYIGGIVLKLGLQLVYLFVSLEEISKAAVCIPRVKSGKWINNLT